MTELAAVVAAYQQRYGAIRSQVLARVDALWRRHGGLSESDAAAWLAAVVPVVEGAQHATTGLVGGYAATMLRLAGDKGTAPSLDAAAAAATRGIDPAEVYMRPVITARAEVSRGATYHEAVEVARTRAGVTAQTDVALAQRDSMAQVEHQSTRIVGWRRVLTGASCAFCATASTQRYGGPNLMPIHDRCVVGSTIVSARSAREVSRRWYQGEVIVLRTAVGHKLTITPNHPVLTTRGWVSAGELSEGVHLVSRPGHNRPGDRVPDEHDVPASIEQRFRAASVVDLVAVPFAAEHFHGDRGDGEVDVVPAYRHLGNGVFSEPAEQHHELLLAGGPGPRVGLTGLCRSHQALLGLGTAPLGSVRGGGLSHPFLGGHLARSDLAGGRVAADRDAVRLEVPSQRPAIDAERLRERVRGLPGDVALDRIVELRRVGGSHHVYNLHTSDGWYLANSIVVHNCDCGVAPIIGSSDPGHVINRPLLDNLKAAAKEAKGTSSGYWSNRHASVDEDGNVTLTQPAVKQHGELGPVLVDPEHHFDGPAVAA